MPVDWSEIEGHRLGLMLVASNEEEGGGVLSGPVVRVERGFALGRSSAPPFPLLPEWANRARRLADVREADVRSIIGDVDYFLWLLSETSKTGKRVFWPQASTGTTSEMHPPRGCTSDQKASDSVVRCSVH